MKLKTLLLATACSLGLGSAAYAFDQSMIDSIASELAAQGYTHMEVKISPNGAKIEASGPNGQIERRYDSAGNLLNEEQGGSGSGGGSDSSGNSNSGVDSDYDNDYDNDFGDDSNDDSSDDDHKGSSGSHSQDDDSDDGRSSDRGGSSKDDHGSNNDSNDDEGDDD